MIDQVSAPKGQEGAAAASHGLAHRFEEILRAVADGVTVQDRSGRLVYANEAAAGIIGFPSPEALLEATSEEILARFEIFDESGEPLSPANLPGRHALAGLVPEPLTIRFRVRASSEDHWSIVKATPLPGADGTVEYAINTFHDITARVRAQENQRFLAEASAVLGESLDYEETLRRVARLAVPRIGDWCAVEIVDPEGAVEWITVEHVDPDKVEMALELRRRHPPAPDATTGVRAVLRSGRPEVVSRIPPEQIDAAAVDDEDLQLLRALQLRSYMCVPLKIGDRVIGAITFVGAESGREYGADDLPFAESLAARAAAAIENARLFREVASHHQIHDATLDAVLVVDPPTLAVLYANEGAAAQAGRPSEELVGLRADMLLALEGRRLTRLIAPIVAGEAGSRVVTTELRRADGRAVPVELLIGPLTRLGEPTRIVAVARDITERIEAQARLQRLAEAEHARAAELNAVIRAIGEAVFVCAEDGLIGLTNPAAEDLFPGVMPRTFDEVLAQLEFEGEPPVRLGVRSGPVEVRARGLADRWLELSSYPVVAQASRVPTARGTIVMIRDVTEARQRETVRDAFLGVLSHELRTPVTTIYGGSKILARPDSTLSEDRRRELFDDIRFEAERLHRLVEDVIALNRFGEDSGDIGREPILIQRILPGVVESERPRWPGVQFMVRVPPGIPTVIADETYVEQVIRNLLSNAAKYAGASAHVETIVEAAGDEVLVRVLDDGPGFPAEDAVRLFDLFFRSPSTAAKASGAGIGLFVCARLVRAMGGRIWAVPRDGGGGAEFGFALRRMEED